MSSVHQVFLAVIRRFLKANFKKSIVLSYDKIQLIACAVGCIFLTWCLQEGETADKMYADRETILALRVPGNLFRAAICKGCLNSVDKRILPVYNVS